MSLVIAFSGSNSSTSINQRLIKSVSKQVLNYKVEILDIREFEIPMFSENIEKEGPPENLVRFLTKLKTADRLIISTPEHNSLLPAVFKNLLDWLSRIERKFLTDKKLILLSTSNGAGGGKRAIEYLVNMTPRWGAELVGHYSVPNFNESLLEENLKEPHYSFIQKMLDEW